MLEPRMERPRGLLPEPRDHEGDPGGGGVGESGGVCGGGRSV